MDLLGESKHIEMVQNKCAFHGRYDHDGNKHVLPQVIQTIEAYRKLRLGGPAEDGYHMTALVATVDVIYGETSSPQRLGLLPLVACELGLLLRPGLLEVGSETSSCNRMYATQPPMQVEAEVEMWQPLATPMEERLLLRRYQDIQIERRGGTAS
ncbi:hypothetical protein LTR97_006968 [Elasticomyces elasticus]|uniref:Uncharacterized protein n=1 Tax=Elasticomyces elasticus TaxID=574655 RepID=A0AAN7W5S6_9PEZI|nr:hypothetical protein LTR97_006968 [Elasticomyces elasticus]